MNVQKNNIQEIAEQILRRYGHIKRMHDEILPRAVVKWEAEGIRRRRRGGERLVEWMK